MPVDGQPGRSSGAGVRYTGPSRRKDQPMKPIPGWMLVSKRTGKPKESAGAAGLALIYFDAEVARD
jgi:hypothetical protein